MIDTTKPVNRDGNRFCGPLVVAAITGTSSGQVAAQVAALRLDNFPGVLKPRSRAAIRGTNDAELFEVLQRAGVRVEQMPIAGARYRPANRVWVSNIAGRYSYMRNGLKPWNAPADAVEWTLLKRIVPTLGLWVVRLSKEERRQTFIVNVPGHWLLYSDGKITETYTDGKWVPWFQAPRQRRQVRAVWRVTA